MLRAVYWAACACWAGPLVVGIVIFIAWLAMRSADLERAGMYNIGVGLALLCVGGVALTIVSMSHPADHPDRTVHKRVFLCALLLLSNIPVAVGFVSAAAVINSRYTVVVENRTPAQLNEAHVAGGGVDVSFGPVPANTTARRSFRIKREGELSVFVNTGAQNHEVTINGYVASGFGGHDTVTIHPDATITVESR